MASPNSQQKKDPRQLTLPLDFEQQEDIEAVKPKVYKKKRKPASAFLKYSGVGYLRIGTAGSLPDSRRIRKPDH